ncbi:circularly permuted type 2 ATP-grasp protein [uncultured Pseudomonas sp.]|uniref:circularly permuted type 2 ATP-grasp protein n=1 Tax=uncultured Pseudomonas sp. TaxID=114707 RepID=UPI002616DA78|nr:circularly permuted type 2 ATP-grasp protein [uncultured Pseudomonas sp.]
MLDKFLADYRVASGSYDELLDSQHQPRAHWRGMLGSLAQESALSMNQRLDAVTQQIRENGVTYNVYTDTKGIQRPWDLNLLPLILPDDEWAGIEAAVIQRAGLLNQILGDVYGDQRLLKEGLLPAALVHGNAGFLRPAHGIKHPDQVALHFYAADLARAPDGKWWVVADRTQAPSGAGYALENRSVLSRSYPDLMRELKVQDLGDFFSSMRNSMVHWGRQCAERSGASLRASEAPLVVLLTPGPYNETYYEQAYLARHLGFPLVEGSDLTVRDGIVCLKTLSGLQRVHVIMRRVDDDFCDPLELLTESALGVAGLTEAARQGNVLIANSLGSNLLESGALLGFLPGLCQRLLGEELLMPSVATWWCGEPAALEEVLDKFDQLVIKPSFAQLRQRSVFGKDVQGLARDKLIAKMRATPRNYVAQELVRLSHAPIWSASAPQGLASSAIGLRVYACATPNGYCVMPGGLTRVATGVDSRIISMQRGGGSKDTWVLGRSAHTAPRQISRTTRGKDLIRDNAHLSSRLAENLLWLGRNTERCDNVARLTRLALNQLFTPQERGEEWDAVKALCYWSYLIQPTFREEQVEGAADEVEASQNEPVPLTDEQIEAALLLGVVSPRTPGLARQQQSLYFSAGQLRERLSADNWRALNHMLNHHVEDDTPLSQAESMHRLDEATATLMGLSGFALDGMTRDLGWSFMSIGRRLERLQFQAQAIIQALQMPEESDLDWLLELSDSIVTYRSRYRAQAEWLPVLDLLLLDQGNPRSLLFQLDGLNKNLNKLAQRYDSAGETLLLPVQHALQALDPDRDLYCGNSALLDLLQQIKTASEQLSEQLSARFFSYTAGFDGKQGAL